MRPFRPRRSLAANEPRTVAEVVDRVQIDWAALEYAVSSLTSAQLTTPGPEGWSVKDHLMHIGDWEKAVTAVLHRRPQYEGFGLNEATYVGLATPTPTTPSTPCGSAIPRRSLIEGGEQVFW